MSYLVSRITGTDLCFGSPMPRGSTLTTSQLQVLTDWVAEGAPNS